MAAIAKIAASEKDPPSKAGSIHPPAIAARIKATRPKALFLIPGLQGI